MNRNKISLSISSICGLNKGGTKGEARVEQDVQITEERGWKTDTDCNSHKRRKCPQNPLLPPPHTARLEDYKGLGWAWNVGLVEQRRSATLWRETKLFSTSFVLIFYRRKELSFCHKLKFSNPYGGNPWYF